MVKCLERSSTELLILLELNRPELRKDPWNPAPHILEAVERGELVYLCMQRLLEYNQPPLLTVAHYIDFFRQVLEVFLLDDAHPISHGLHRDLYSYTSNVSLD